MSFENINLRCLWVSLTRIQTLVPRWDKCIKVTDDYVEVWFVLSDTHVIRIHRRYNNVLGIRMFGTLFFETDMEQYKVDL